MRDLHNNIKVETAINISAITTNATTVGNIIDMQGFRSIEFIILSGMLTDGNYVPLLQDGSTATLTDATTVTAANMLGTTSLASFTLSDDNVVKKIGYIGNKRYVRLGIVTTGVTTGGTISAISVKTNAL